MAPHDSDELHDELISISRVVRGIDVLVPMQSYTGAGPVWSLSHQRNQPKSIDKCSRAHNGSTGGESSSQCSWLALYKVVRPGCTEMPLPYCPLVN